MSRRIVIGAALVGIILLVLVLSIVIQKENNREHAPIFINGDNQFTSANGVTSGSGTANDPYIIENWAINASGTHGITIQSTTAYFIIRNCLVKNGGDSYNGIYLNHVINGRIENNRCNNNSYGIRLYVSSNNTVTNNICENNTNSGIYLWISSNYNTLTGNICENNSQHGISLRSSSYDTLIGNTCENNIWYGIYLGASTYDNLINNNFSKNNYGIYLISSSNNTFTYNYLLNNAENNAQDGGLNNWDNGSHGNYWSDWQPPQHSDADNNGIVDDSRPIFGGTNQDNYPLVIF